MSCFLQEKSSSDGKGYTINLDDLRSQGLLNDIKDGMMLHIVPDTLLAARWLQCARVLTDNRTFKACERCGKWFELSPSARRKHSKYCSGTCKVAAHRARNPVDRTSQ